jgi:hypothetical protein
VSLFECVAPWLRTVQAPLNVRKFTSPALRRQNIVKS